MKDRVVRVSACRLKDDPSPWLWPQSRAHHIEAHWARRTAENPAFFNGAIYILRDCHIAGGLFEASFVRTDFKSFLYWREQGYPDAGVKDGFGAALIRSREGHVLLGRQSAGHINSGLAYLPGGFIDARDVAADGSIDIEASVWRELGEETGLERSDLVREPGFFVTFAGSLVSIAVPFQSPLDSHALQHRILAHIASEPNPELSSTEVVRTRSGIAGLKIAPYAQILLAAVLE